MSTSSKNPTAPKTATVSLTIAGRTWTATAPTRNEALVLLAKQIEQESN